MSFVQRLIQRFAPDRAAEIERESREWFVVCPECGRSASLWELGGVRYKAASKGKRILARCSGCGKRVMARVERRRPDPGNP